MRLLGGDRSKTSLEPLFEAGRRYDLCHSPLEKIAKAAADFRPRFAIGAKRHVRTEILLLRIPETAVEEEVNNALHILTEHPDLPA
jgi:hypothetical protein